MNLYWTFYDRLQSTTHNQPKPGYSTSLIVGVPSVRVLSNVGSGQIWQRQKHRKMERMMYCVDRLSLKWQPCQHSNFRVQGENEKSPRRVHFGLQRTWVGINRWVTRKKRLRSDRRFWSRKGASHWKGWLIDSGSAEVPCTWTKKWKTKSRVNKMKRKEENEGKWSEKRKS